MNVIGKSSKRTLGVVAVLIFATIGLAANAANTNWTVTKDSWTATDERNYSAFISALGEAKCNTIDSCLRNPANPYRSTDPEGYKFWSDCAKFPYLLRAYFAWKNNLPFSYVSDVNAAEGQGADLRYSPKGNVVISRREVTSRDGRGVDAIKTLDTIQNDVNSAMFRFNPNIDISTGNLFFDFFPVKVDRNEIRPGTIIYDPNGHVAVVYKVESDGRIRFFDAHPDSSVSHGVYGEKFARSSPGMGAGFKSFRPLKLVHATADSSGVLSGGYTISIPNASNPSFSAEQFFGTNPSADGVWKKGTFVVNGQPLEYYDFVRTRLAVGDLKYHPVEEMTNMMDALCQDVKDRVLAVDTSLSKGIQLKSQPANLPNNIYGTDGEWESYSTPSRDARLKTSFLELRTRVEEFVNLQRQGNPRVVYEGSNLAQDLRQAYDKSALACQIAYTRSDRSTVKLTFHDISARLFSLDFDPYHCAELRWGASDAGELATCADDATKRAWYPAEQRLRNQIERVYDTRMGFSLDQLRAKAAGSGVDNPPDVDLKKYLDTL
jgi:hypothetical protein